VKEVGNCDLDQRSDPHHVFDGKNILIKRNTFQKAATEFRLTVSTVESIVEESLRRLFEVRCKVSASVINLFPIFTFPCIEIYYNFCIFTFF